MIIQEAGLDFGLVQIGTICETFISIENISNLQVKWTLQPLSHKVNEKFLTFFCKIINFLSRNCFVFH